jgi:hypothetical protein
MGRKRLERPGTDSLFSTVSNRLVPAHVVEHFEIWDAKEYKDRLVIEMREKAGVIPSELTGFDDIVSDGYTNPVETLSHSFVCMYFCFNL